MSDLAIDEVLEDMATQCEGHDLSVEETQSNQPTNVAIRVESQGRTGPSPGGIVTCSSWLVKQGWI